MNIAVCECQDAVVHAKGILPTAETIDVVANIFRLCGDATRVGILCALSRHSLCVCELASVLGMSSSAISHQLRLLKQTGLIRARRAGKSVVYSIANPEIEEIFLLALRYAEETEK